MLKDTACSTIKTIRYNTVENKVHLTLITEQKSTESPIPYSGLTVSRWARRRSRHSRDNPAAALLSPPLPPSDTQEQASPREGRAARRGASPAPAPPLRCHQRALPAPAQAPGAEAPPGSRGSSPAWRSPGQEPHSTSPPSGLLRAGEEAAKRSQLGPAHPRSPAETEPPPPVLPHPRSPRGDPPPPPRALTFDDSAEEAAGAQRGLRLGVGLLAPRDRPCRSARRL